MVEITSKTTTANFTYSDSSYLMDGEYSEKMDGQLDNVNINIKDKENVYKGSATAYMDGEEVRYNISSVLIDDMQSMAQSIKTCVEEIKAKMLE